EGARLSAADWANQRAAAAAEQLEKEESFFSFGGEDYPGKDAEEGLDERVLQGKDFFLVLLFCFLPSANCFSPEYKQLSAIFKTVLDDADERKLGEYTPFGSRSAGDRHIWTTPSSAAAVRVLQQQQQLWASLFLSLPLILRSSTSPSASPIGTLQAIQEA